MKKVILISICLILSINTFAQDERFISGDEAIEWVPQLIGYNIEIIGEQNEKGINATDKKEIEFLFLTDAFSKAEILKKALEEEYKYQMYKMYTLEGLWIVTGVTEQMSMQFDSFSTWTFDLCKFGFGYDSKLISWNIIDDTKAKQIDDFWRWFEENQVDFHDLELKSSEELENVFGNLSNKLNLINEDMVFQFSPLLENGKREFVLSADGRRNSFPDLLSLYKRSPNFDQWEIIPFKQGSEGDPQIQFNDGFTLSWDNVMFNSKETTEGLSIDFYIENYEKEDSRFDMLLILLLDSYLGEYDAVMQIRYVNIYSLTETNKNELSKFKELKQVVEDYKAKKKER